MADNLVLKSGMWHVRFDLPADVRPYFGNRKILSQSLKTGSRTEAMRFRHPILSDWKNQVVNARRTKAEAGDRWKEQLFEDAARHHAQADTVLLSAAKGTFIPSNRPKPTVDSVREGLKKLETDLYDFYRDVLKVEAEYSIPNLFDDITSTMANDDIPLTERLLKFSEFQQRILVHTAKKENYLSDTELREAEEIAASPTTYKPKSPITKAMLDQWHKQLEHQVKSEKTRDSHLSRVQRLSDYLTSEGKPLSFDSVHDFLESVSEARKTRQQYLWSGRDFWQWACKYHKGFRGQFANAVSPFDGHSLPKVGAAAGESYVPFTKEEVEALHAKALAKEDIPLANLIAFGAFTGCRLEEMGRIKPEDTILEKGKPVGFRITEAKTAAGIREIPIHPDLLPLYEYLTKQAPSNDGFLFPGGKNKYGNRLDGLSKRFGRLKSSSFSELHTFHSIRKTMVTELHQRGVTLEILPYLVGHESKAFTLDIYSSGPSFKQKKAAIGKLKFSFTGIYSTQ
ncbi:tyrosine-type recombinase/integrase [Pseudomonas sp. HN11]|uniref:tyrosine-type recombinase/integrase n=1 Tax=Pseudomonas sp. HN11 TaxID=1344094 RepID=UPI001F2E0F5F|nr:tyrosine-type recombinase/integrase [Pseudomonas sp. HN11]UII72952.1 tyrosine-type recombinase/integrase [Pseudomonas sp. HN11]